MKEFKVKKISKELNISHSAVSQWFSGCTMPKYNYMVYLYENYDIPFLAWKDIQSYINESITNAQPQIDSTIQGQSNEK